MRKFLCILCVLALVAGLMPAALALPSVTLNAEGWFETICAELTGVTDSQVTGVTYTDADGVETALEGEDFTYLVRDMEGGVRIDIPGVKAGIYSLKVTAGGEDYTSADITVLAYDRSGFAHKYHDGDGVIHSYTEGVGAYNDDGTLKEDAVVLYVTDVNKDEVVLHATRNGGEITATGIGNILNNNNKVRDDILEFLSKEDKKPLVVRFIGAVTAPAGVSEFKMGSSNGGMVYMLSGSNITLEGIGADAAIDGWGFSFGANKDDTQYSKWARNFEVRNLAFKNVPEDCVEITGFGNEDGSIKESVEHAWVHNCEFYVPHIANPAESDKAQGDGAVDFKWGRYMTMSYNYFQGYHKTSLIGAGDNNQQYHVTWHHNWWKNVESRAPLCRQANVHIYNNLFDGQTSYCMSLRANCYIFSEYNTFLNCKNPVVDEGSGGVCKSYRDSFAADCTGVNNAQKVLDRDIVVDSQNPYASFELNSDLSYIPDGDYLLEEDVEDAQTMIAAYTGTMKPLAEITHPDVHHHIWSEWDVEVANTCTEGGHRTRTCLAEGCPLENGLDDQITVPLGHRWSPWQTVKEATCATDGEHTHTCTRCNDATASEAIPATGHSYNASGICATCGAIDTAENHLFDPGKLAAAGGSGGDDFFTFRYATGTLNSNKKNFAGYTSSYRVSTGGTAPSTTANCVSFTTSGSATVTIYWGAGDANRQMVVLDDTGKEAAVTAEESVKNGLYTSVLKLDQGGTYHLGSKGGQNYLYGFRVSCEKNVLSQGELGESGDALLWSYTEDGTLNIGGLLPQTDQVLAACWDSAGRFEGVKLLDASHMGTELEAGAAKIKLFWVNGEREPKCEAVTAWEKK